MQLSTINYYAGTASDSLNHKLTLGIKSGQFGADFCHHFAVQPVYKFS